MCRRSRSSSTSSPHVRHAVPSARSQHRTRAPGSQVACRARRPTGARQVDRDRCVPSQGKVRPADPCGCAWSAVWFRSDTSCVLGTNNVEHGGPHHTVTDTRSARRTPRTIAAADNPLRRPRAPLPPHVIASPPNLAYLPIQLMLYKSCSGTLVWNALLCMLCCCTAHGFVVGSKRRASSIARDWRQAPNICT